MKCRATGKIRHANERKALGHIAYLEREGLGNPDMSAYFCRACGGYHIGHNVRLFSRRIRAALRKAD